MLKAAVDVFYSETYAKAVCVLFEPWNASDAFSTHTALMDVAGAYEPGAFYKRELPPVLSVLHQVNLSLVDAIIVDGYVYLDDAGRKGLGAYLYEALGGNIPVIGVAKTAFHGNRKNVAEVLRGKSRKPLFVTAIGKDLAEAIANIQLMAGDYRIPEILKYLDKKTKEENE